MPRFMDHTMSRRLERTEGAVAVSFVATRDRVTPAIGAAWHDFDGTYAIFDGIDSPMSQTFGLGMFSALTPETLTAIETFFDVRGVDVMHEVSPLAGIETISLLVDRGYRPSELSTILVQDIADRVEAPNESGLTVRQMQPEDRAAWIEASVTGWSEDPGLARVIRSIAELASANRTMVHFLVEHAGAAIATASLGIHDGVALLAGASTVPSGRGLGAQALLLSARLAEARQRGCEISMIATTPGSTSQRNAERRGFRVAYTRTKWRLARRPAAASG